MTQYIEEDSLPKIVGNRDQRRVASQLAAVADTISLARSRLKQAVIRTLSPRAQADNAAPGALLAHSLQPPQLLLCRLRFAANSAVGAVETVFEVPFLSLMVKVADAIGEPKAAVPEMLEVDETSPCYL